LNKNISILGAGSWGTALSILLAQNGHKVTGWSVLKDEVEMLNEKKEHLQKLPGERIPDSVYYTDDIEKCLKGHDLVVIVTPSQHVRSTCKLASKYMNKGDIVVCCSKGIEDGTGKRLSEVIEDEIEGVIPVALYGPSHAEEVAKKIPTTVVSASKDIIAAQFVQDAFMSNKFRVYTNYDLIGVELGAALKNVIALCAGICDGLGLGDNSKAALMTRGITEIARLGAQMGGKTQTFAGLTGIGDLIVTCTSMHSRNRRAGILIGQGYSVEAALNEVKMVVEGVVTAKAAYELSLKYNVSMPITEEAYKVLFEGKSAKEAVVDLMERGKKHEIEDIFFE